MAPRELFTYLVDPVNRPEWQASLLSVTVHDRGEPHVGQRWTDHTMVGARPRMETTALVPFKVFEESGRWHGVRAELSMRFTAVPTGSRVHVSGTMTGSGVWAPIAAATARAAGLGIRVDLARAARVLAAR